MSREKTVSVATYEINLMRVTTQLLQQEKLLLQNHSVDFLGGPGRSWQFMLSPTQVKRGSYFGAQRRNIKSIRSKYKIELKVET